MLHSILLVVAVPVLATGIHPATLRLKTGAWQMQCLFDALKTTNLCTWQNVASAIACVC